MPSDPELSIVADALRDEDPDGSRWAAVIRHTYDMIYDGQHTGRYRWDQLMKTEKTHFGSLLEINAQRAFGFSGGSILDFSIDGVEVDAKWSQTDGGWMLPPEVFDRLALVVTGSDELSRWSLGLIRVTVESRREKTNRDRKSQLNQHGRDSIEWIWRNAPLPPNVLLALPRERVDHIFDHLSGTKRVDRLFREALGQIVHRTSVETVAQQLDSQKRVRGNGGSRSALAPEGILILSGAYHANLAEALGAPVPSPVEYLAVRVVPSEDDHGALIDGRRWRLASDEETIDIPAPSLPSRGEVSTALF